MSLADLPSPRYAWWPGLADARDNRAAEDAQVARDALIRMEALFGGAVLPSAVLTSWAAEASAVVSGMLRVAARKASGEALPARADHLLEGVRAAGLADRSDLLPSGLSRRFAALAAELRAATSGRALADPDQAIVTRDGLDRVERAWASVAAHYLAGDDRRTHAFHAAVRLTRWLADVSPDGTELPTLLRRHAASTRPYFFAALIAGMVCSMPRDSRPALMCG